MTTPFAESIVEDAALAWLASLGYAVLHGPDIAAGMLGAERSDPNYRDVVLEGRLHQALVRLNPNTVHLAILDADPHPSHRRAEAPPGSKGELAHLALDPAGHLAPATGHDAVPPIDELGQQRLMEGRTRPRGE